MYSVRLRLRWPTIEGRPHLQTKVRMEACQKASVEWCAKLARWTLSDLQKLLKTALLLNRVYGMSRFDHGCVTSPYFLALRITWACPWLQLSCRYISHCDSPDGLRSLYLHLHHSFSQCICCIPSESNGTTKSYPLFRSPQPCSLKWGEARGAVLLVLSFTGSGEAECSACAFDTRQPTAVPQHHTASVQ